MLLLAGLWLSACFNAKTKTEDGGQDGGPGALASCGVVGRSVACVGPGGCLGGQVCQQDGSFGTCDCAIAPVAGGSGQSDDASMAMDAAVAACGVGTACTSASDCAPGFSCIEDLSAYIPATDLPDGGNRVPIIFFPGGVCSPVPLTAWDDPRACDVLAPEGLQGCGDCGRCGGVNLASGLVVACLEPCTPSPTSSGCSREGYTCDLITRACMQGCTSDVECKLVLLDSDGTGLSDLSRYDPDSASVCDPTTLRCTHPGTPGATAGDPCSHDDDCEADGMCFGSERGFAGNLYIDGYCSKTGCNNAGFECAGEGVCAEFRSWSPFPTVGSACRKGCTQGAEEESLRLGPGGHGDGCRDGYMCVWAGVPRDPSGFCEPGNYNDVASPNLGQQCTASSECYSPHGHGLCLEVADGLSICTVMDCDTPGLPTEVYGDEGACFQLDNGRTACMRRCTDASDCPASLACVPAVGAIPTEITGICAPCENDAECITGQLCDQGICRN